MPMALFIVGGCISGRPGNSSEWPNVVGEWRLSGEIAEYTPETLYKYIDGAAEVYRSFNVRRVWARKYTKNGLSDIVVDVFEMATAADAFGVYRHEIRQGEDVGVGQESEYLRGTLSFWKGRFFVVITPYDDSAEVRETVLHIGRFLEKSFAEEGEQPRMLQYCPEEERQSGKIRYFHNHICLNQYYFLSDKNVLLLNQETEGLVVPYGDTENNRIILILVKYPDERSCSQAFTSFLEFLSETCLIQNGFAIHNDGTVTLSGRCAEYLVVVRNTPNKEHMNRLYHEVIASIQESGTNSRRKD